MIAGEIHSFTSPAFILLLVGQAVLNINGFRVHVEMGQFISVQEGSIIEVLDGGSPDLAGWEALFTAYSGDPVTGTKLKFNWQLPSGESFQIVPMTGGFLANISNDLKDDAYEDAAKDRNLVGNQLFLYKLLNLLYMLRLDEQPSAESGIMTSITYMQEQYAEVITREKLAQVAGITQWHYSRKFAEAFGQPPLDYLARHRIYRAQEELLLSSALAPI
ncbi:hypothetical protein ACX93W_12295 [Paenibacillus sp. CAU 1782]